jgi:hypothetical protein
MHVFEIRRVTTTQNTTKSSKRIDSGEETTCRSKGVHDLLVIITACANTWIHIGHMMMIRASMLERPGSHAAAVAVHGVPVVGREAPVLLTANTKTINNVPSNVAKVAQRLQHLVAGVRRNSTVCIVDWRRALCESIAKCEHI